MFSSLCDLLLSSENDTRLVPDDGGSFKRRFWGPGGGTEFDFQGGMVKSF